MTRKLGALPPFGGGQLVPNLAVAWTKAHLHAKCHLDPSSRLATINMGRKLGGHCPLLEEGDWVPF